jgi:hypothetical protein
MEILKGYSKELDQKYTHLESPFISSAITLLKHEFFSSLFRSDSILKGGIEAQLPRMTFRDSDTNASIEGVESHPRLHVVRYSASFCDVPFVFPESESRIES